VALMAGMDAVAPGMVHRVVYEALVAETGAQVRALLDALDLPFEPACLAFWQNDRAVRTASAEQVRQPLYASGVGYWKHFETELAPLRCALGDVLERF
jgi:hypothetical protein